MLGSTNIIAFVPIKDSDKARAFYEGMLGLRFMKDDGFALVLECQRNHGACREDEGIHAGAVHDPGMAGRRH